MTDYVVMVQDYDLQRIGMTEEFHRFNQYPKDQKCIMIPVDPGDEKCLALLRQMWVRGLRWKGTFLEDIYGFVAIVTGHMSAVPTNVVSATPGFQACTIYPVRTIQYTVRPRAGCYVRMYDTREHDPDVPPTGGII